jgi:hypothetical protein
MSGNFEGEIPRIECSRDDLNTEVPTPNVNNVIRRRMNMCSVRVAERGGRRTWWIENKEDLEPTPYVNTGIRRIQRAHKTNASKYDESKQVVTRPQTPTLPTNISLIDVLNENPNKQSLGMFSETLLSTSLFNQIKIPLGCPLTRITNSKFIIHISLKRHEH